MTVLQQRLQRRLEERRAQALYRHRLTLGSAQGASVHLEGQEFLCFCSNDYLGLANHPKLVESMREAAAKYGVGSGASHLVVGHNEVHHALESELAEFTGRSRALLFSSGYMANLGVISSLVGRSDYIFEDRLNHASLLDGGLLSRANFKRFAHNNVADLQQSLQNVVADTGKLVVVDGVYSMDGDMAPLGQLSQACEASDALLMVDDAHGFGVLGTAGRGSVEAAGLSCSQVPVLMGTLGKALGCAGAFVAGDEDLIEGLIQFARTYIYTTAIPPAVAAATRTALQLLQQENWRQQHLQHLIKRFRVGAESVSLPLMDSESAIQPIMVGSSETAVQLSASLRQRGILVSAIRPPTVPADTARLRVTLTAAHSEADVDRLLDALADCIRQ